MLFKLACAEDDHLHCNNSIIYLLIYLFVCFDNCSVFLGILLCQVVRLSDLLNSDIVSCCDMSLHLVYADQHLTGPHWVRTNTVVVYKIGLQLKMICVYFVFGRVLNERISQSENYHLSQLYCTFVFVFPGNSFYNSDMPTGLVSENSRTLLKANML